MKKRKIFAISVLLLVLLISILYGCTDRVFETDYFVCWKFADGDFIAICDFTELAKQQKYLVIPKEVNGYRVNAVQDRRYLYGTVKVESETLEKMYVNEGISIEASFDNCPQFKKFIIFGNAHISFLSEEIDYYYFSDDIYPEYWQREDKETTTPSPANVSYFYNYENELQPEFYWLDDIEDGEKIEYIPENPVREGYAFGGWYKEPQCINKWDFEGDKVVKIKLSEVKEREDFIETRLYAKWTKN